MFSWINLPQSTDPRPERDKDVEVESIAVSETVSEGLNAVVAVPEPQFPVTVPVPVPTAEATNCWPNADPVVPAVGSVPTKDAVKIVPTVLLEAPINVKFVVPTVEMMYVFPLMKLPALVSSAPTVEKTVEPNVKIL
jgi:hypothetical protein